MKAREEHEPQKKKKKKKDGKKGKTDEGKESQMGLEENPMEKLIPRTCAS